MHGWKLWSFDGIESSQQIEFAIVVRCRVAQNCHLNIHWALIKTRTVQISTQEIKGPSNRPRCRRNRSSVVSRVRSIWLKAKKEKDRLRRRRRGRRRGGRLLYTRRWVLLVSGIPASPLLGGCPQIMWLPN